MVPVEQSLTVGKPPAIIKSEIKDRIYKTWGKQWMASQEAKHTKAFYYCPNPQKSKYVLKLARLELGRFIRLITGHNNLNYFQTRIGLHNDSKCRLCGEEDETFIHFVRTCPRLHSSRVETFGDKLPTNDMRWSVRNLIDFSYIPTVNRAFEGTWSDGSAMDPDTMDPVQTEHDDMRSESSYASVEYS